MYEVPKTFEPVIKLDSIFSEKSDKLLGFVKDSANQKYIKQEKEFKEMDKDKRKAEIDKYIKKNQNIFNDDFKERIKRAAEVIKVVMGEKKKEQLNEFKILELTILLLSVKYKELNIPVFHLNNTSDTVRKYPTNAMESAYFTFIKENV